MLRDLETRTRIPKAYGVLAIAASCAPASHPAHVINLGSQFRVVDLLQHVWPGLTRVQPYRLGPPRVSFRSGY